MSDDKTDDKAKPKKKGLVKPLMMGVGGLVLVGGGVGAGLYAGGAVAGGGAHAEEKETPHLVPKSEEKRAGEGGESEGGGHGGGEDEGGGGESHGGLPTPEGEGGDKYASTYYPMEKEFTSNLLDSVHFVQVGLAVSTPYDDRVIENLRTHEIAVRSAILMSLGETDEDQVFTLEGKKQLQRRLASAINGVLKQKEGFGGISNVYFTNFVVQ